MVRKYNLDETIAAGDPLHPETHQAIATSVNDLDDRTADIETDLSTRLSPAELSATIVDKATALAASAAAGRYEKPETGIPDTDLAGGVRTSLSLIGTAVQPVDVPRIVDARNVRSYLAARASLRESGPVVIVVAGHSVAAGSSATDPSLRWINQFSDHVHNAYPRATGPEPEVRTLAQAVSTAPSGAGIHVINAAVSGSKSDSYLTTTTRAQVMGLAPAIVIHSDLPANDVYGGVTADTVYANLVSQLDALDELATSPVLHVFTTAYLRWTNAAPSTEAEYRNAIYRLASRPNVVVLSEFNTWNRLQVENSDPIDYLSADNVHPNDRGHTAAALMLAQGFGLTPASVMQPARVIRASDSFSVTGALNGSAADLAYGGQAATWASNPTDLYTKSAAGSATSKGATKGFAGLPIPDNANIRFSAVLKANPSNAYAMLDLFRGPAGSAFQFGIDSFGSVILILSTPTIYRKLSLTPVSLVGQRLAIEYYKGTLSAYVNGLRVASCTPPSGAVTFTSKNVGFSSMTTSTAHVWGDPLVEILV